MMITNDEGEYVCKMLPRVAVFVIPTSSFREPGW